MSLLLILSSIKTEFIYLYILQQNPYLLLLAIKSANYSHIKNFFLLKIYMFDATTKKKVVSK